MDGFALTQAQRRKLASTLLEAAKWDLLKGLRHLKEAFMLWWPFGPD
jgi:hypothetical protein